MIDCGVADRLVYAVRSALMVVFLLGAVKRFQQSVGFLRLGQQDAFMRVTEPSGFAEVLRGSVILMVMGLMTESGQAGLARLSPRGNNREHR